jgi:hypothetical protein
MTTITVGILLAPFPRPAIPGSLPRSSTLRRADRAPPSPRSDVPGNAVPPGIPPVPGNAEPQLGPIPGVPAKIAHRSNALF